jgi:CubicO group peptidase (beta-lactamase class C family)
MKPRASLFVLARRAALVLGLVLLGLLAAEVLRFARVAAGFSATIGAVQAFATGDELDTLRAERLRMPFGFERWVTLELEPETRTARASVFGLARAEARWREGLGVTRAHDDGIALPDELPDLVPPLDPTRPWPLGESEVVVELEPARAQALQAAVERAFVTPDGAALATHAVVVVQAGELRLERYRADHDRATRFLGWSMTKTVTAALLGRLVMLGQVRGLDEPLAAPEWSAPGDARASIELQSFLRMTSGLAWSVDYEDPASDSLRMLFREPSAAHFAATKSLEHAPDTHFEYSDGTSNLLARFVFERAGASDEERWLFPQKELFGRLGMSSAVLSVDPSGRWVGSSLMLATARDWARFGEFLRRDGTWSGERFLPDGWVTMMRHPTDGSPQRTYGAHLWRTDPELLRDADGNSVPPELAGVVHLAGFDDQFVWIDFQRELVLVRLGLTDPAFDPEDFAASVLRVFDAP